MTRVRGNVKMEGPACLGRREPRCRPDPPRQQGKRDGARRISVTPLKVLGSAEGNGLSPRRLELPGFE